MKHEEPKAESSIKSTISEIKKAEERKEVEDEVVEIKKKTVAEAIKNEMLGCNENEIKSTVEELEINPELEELIKYSGEINEIVKKYDTFSFIKPKGRNGISYEEEFNLFLEKMEKYLDDERDISDEEYLEMCPVFTYPEIEKIEIEDLENRVSKLKELEEEIKSKCESENIAKIAFELIEIAEAKINFHKHLKEGDLKKAFESSKIIYGNINDDLCLKANEAYEQNLAFLENKAEKSELEITLENNEFDAEDIKNYFEIAIVKAGLKDSGYEAVIDNSVSNITTAREGTSKYNHPVVLIPPDKKVNGIRLLELVAHEIGRHVVTDVYNTKQGLKGGMGKGWDVSSEGIAMKSEREIRKTIFNDLDPSFKYNSNKIYFVLAMEKIKDGYNFAQVYKYLYDLNYKEELYKSGYYNLKDESEDLDNKDRNLENKIADLEKESKLKAIDSVEKICLRIFRGFDPKQGGMYFPKDKIYFEGEVQAFEMDEIESGQELEKYLRLSKVDPKFISYLIKMGAYTYKKGLQMAKDVAKQIWQDKGWTADYIKEKGWYDENTPKHLGQWGYRDKYMNEEKTGLKDE
ncbi:DUF1704 domain-containing protein [Candidatus Parcubacteria bacterium]|nr:DUF1704 domain-containing protein [Candidatus Parcubacteria bacterium]